MNCTFLIGCDQNYYDVWGINLLKSIKYFNNGNNYKLHCHIVNPKKDFTKIAGVIYTTEEKDFLNRNNEIAYLQCSRFLAVQKYYSNNEIIVTLDADSICTRKFTEIELEELLSKNHVLTRGKPTDNRWLAGMIVFKDKRFKEDYAISILSKKDFEWEYGWDQTVLAELANKYNFNQLPSKWMSIGKNGLKRVFLTLKGTSQKTESKYIDTYHNLIKKINND